MPMLICPHEREGCAGTDLQKLGKPLLQPPLVSRRVEAANIEVFNQRRSRQFAHVLRRGVCAA
jgi:hypothetical protein